MNAPTPRVLDTEAFALSRDVLEAAQNLKALERQVAIARAAYQSAVAAFNAYAAAKEVA